MASGVIVIAGAIKDAATSLAYIASGTGSVVARIRRRRAMGLSAAGVLSAFARRRLRRVISSSASGIISFLPRRRLRRTLAESIAGTVGISPRRRRRCGMIASASAAMSIVGSVTAPASGYRYIKWDITNIRSSSITSICQASEVKFYTSSGAFSWPAGITITDEGGTIDGPNVLSRLIDNSTATKWGCSNWKTRLHTNIIIDLGAGNSVALTAYEYATATDSPERDPRSWVLSGSSDGSTWTTLSTVTDFYASTTRQAWSGQFTVT